MVVHQEVWVAITNMVVTISRQADTGAMELDTVQAHTATAIVEDGVVPITGTDPSIGWSQSLQMRCRPAMSLVNLSVLSSLAKVERCQ